MNKIYDKFFFIVIVLCSILAFSACSDDDDLVGTTWTSTDKVLLGSISPDDIDIVLRKLYFKTESEFLFASAFKLISEGVIDEKYKELNFLLGIRYEFKNSTIIVAGISFNEYTLEEILYKGNTIVMTFTDGQKSESITFHKK